MHIVGYDAIVAGQRWALDGGPAPLAICVINLAVAIAAERNAEILSAGETRSVTMTYAMLHGMLFVVKSSASRTSRLKESVTGE